MANDETQTVDGAGQLHYAQLQNIDAKLACGQLDEARSAAALLLSQLPDDASRAPVSAEATLRLSYCDLALSRAARALDSATDSAEMFRLAADPRGEIAALSLISAAAGRLGRSMQAVEAGLVSVALVDELKPGLWAAQASLALGRAYVSAHSFARAQRAFEDAASLATRHGPATCVAEVWVDQALGEVLRLIQERDESKTIGSLESLGRLVERIRSIGDDTSPSVLTPGAGTDAIHAAASISKLFDIWSHRCGNDESWLQLSASTQPGMSRWIAALGHLIECEKALKASDISMAAERVADMLESALHAEHAPLLHAAHLVAACVHERCGAFEHALLAMKQSRAHERTMRLQELLTREERLPVHLALRNAELDVLALTAQSKAFELLAFEDTLTGIANLRRFKQRLMDLESIVRDTGEPLCAAFIDVNRFKWVNDTFLHDVGDAVLKTIASIIVTHVREVDLAARLHGDEFAILFRNLDEATAKVVCDRIRTAVRTHAWNDLAEGLQVSISLGIVQAQPGDTAEQLIKRSDDAMYVQKRLRFDEPFSATSAPRISQTLLERVATWIERSERVVVFVGAEHEREHAAVSGVDSLPGWSAEQRRQFGHVDGFWANQRTFLDFWEAQKEELALVQPTEVHRLLVELSKMRDRTTFVTERIDGVLTKAGAGHVIELFGNAFRNRCVICGQAAASGGMAACTTCGHKGTTMAPDVVLLGEATSGRLHGGAELAAKRADVILVVGSDASVFPGPSLLDKARVRGARVVMLGNEPPSRSNAVDVSIQGSEAEVLAALLDRLRSGNPDPTFRHDLSDDGFASLCFLSGNGTDHQGRTLEEILAWDDRQIKRHSDATQWQFPLLTRSRVCPEAPVPTEADFDRFAVDQTVKAAVHRSFCRMLLHFGFEWANGRVVRTTDWKSGFERWSHLNGTDNLRISRILGSLTLCGLKAEADAFLLALEREVPWVKAHDTRGPMHFWKAAVQVRTGRDRETTNA